MRYFPWCRPTFALRPERAREAARREEREQKAREALERVVSAVRSVLGRGERAWVFASLASGEVREHSDVNLALDGVARGKLVTIARRVAAAANSSVDFTSKTYRPAFRARIERERVSIP